MNQRKVVHITLKVVQKLEEVLKLQLRLKWRNYIYRWIKKATVHNLDSKIPYFGTLPMINFFFKNQNISHEISDIYVKMKVNIVNNEMIPLKEMKYIKGQRK